YQQQLFHNDPSIAVCFLYFMETADGLCLKARRPVKKERPHSKKCFERVFPYYEEELMLKSISSSASALKSSICTGSMTGSSSEDSTPKVRRNSSVVPNRIGFPGASSLPSSCTRPYSISLLTAWSHFTPRIFSISIRVTGCL